MTIIELRNKRAQKLTAARAFLESRRNPEGFLSAEDDAAYARMETEITSLGNEIARMERLEEMDAQLAKPVNTPITAKPDAGVKMDTKTGRASDIYKKAFWNKTRSKADMTPEMRNALQEGTDSEGGYLVPDEFENTLVQGLTDNAVIRAHAHVITTSSGLHKIPVVAAHGSAAWIDEEGAYTESDETFGQVQLDAHKVGTVIKVSEELLNDSAFDLESYIASEFVRRIGDKEEEAFLVGNGTGKPTGILNATGGGQVGVTTASATAITADELIDLFYSLKAPYRKNAIADINDKIADRRIRRVPESEHQPITEFSSEKATRFLSKVIMTKFTIKWVKKTNPLEAKKFSCPKLTDNLYDAWNWDKDYIYRATGRLVTVQNKVMLYFDFSEPEKWKKPEAKDAK